MDIETSDKLYALKHWLETFPEFHVSKNEIGPTNNRQDDDHDPEWLDNFENSM